MRRTLKIDPRIHDLPFLPEGTANQHQDFLFDTSPLNEGFESNAQVDVIIIGTKYSDFLNGTAKNDYIVGFENNDTLFGNEGFDTLDGGTGDDYMLGGNGNDVYYIDSSNDVALDSLTPSGGIDFAYTTTSYTLANDSGIEYLSAFSTVSTDFLFLTGANGYETLTGNAGLNFLLGMAGNDSLLGLGGDDWLEGGQGEDRLDGGLGSDTLIGGANNDNYFADNSGDTVREKAGEGIDTVTVSFSYILEANVENVIAREGALVTSLIGNELNNLIRGNAQINTLTGGIGNDTFRLSIGGAATKPDTITDFFAPTDTFLLKSISLDDQTTLLPGQFVLGTKAADINSRVIYDQSTGKLYFDKDGTGAAAQVLFANLANKAAISASDFLIDG